MQRDQSPVTDIFQFTSGRRAGDFIRMLGRGLETQPEGPTPLSIQYRVQEHGEVRYVVSVTASREELEELQPFADLPPEQIENVRCIRSGRLP